MVGSQGSASAPGERVLFGDVFPRHVTRGPWLVPFGQFSAGSAALGWERHQPRTQRQQRTRRAGVGRLVTEAGPSHLKPPCTRQAGDESQRCAEQEAGHRSTPFRRIQAT
jgi:hypothetical protein